MRSNTRAQIFLCHASQDKKATRDLCERLLGEGYEVWLDERSLLPGQIWEQEIRAAVKESDVIVVMISSNSVNKTGFVQRELRLALDAADERPDGSIFLIPFRLDNTPIPPRLSQWHWLDIDDEDWFDRLLISLNSVRRRARSSGSPASLSGLNPVPVAVELLSLECSPETLVPGQTMRLEYRIQLWANQELPAVLDARLLGENGEEYFDTAGDRDVALVPGKAIYRRFLQVPGPTPVGVYRLVGAVWTPRIGDRRLATLDRGFIVTIT